MRLKQNIDGLNLSEIKCKLICTMGSWWRSPQVSHAEKNALSTKWMNHWT